MLLEQICSTCVQYRPPGKSSTEPPSSRGPTASEIAVPSRFLGNGVHREKEAAKQRARATRLRVRPCTGATLGLGLKEEKISSRSRNLNANHVSIKKDFFAEFLNQFASVIGWSCHHASHLLTYRNAQSRSVLESKTDDAQIDVWLKTKRPVRGHI